MHEVRVGDVYPSHGGRPGWKGRTCWWLVASITGNVTHLLGLNADGEIVSTTSYGIHVLQSRKLVGHVSKPITLGGHADIQPVLLGTAVEWIEDQEGDRDWLTWTRKLRKAIGSRTHWLELHARVRGNDNGVEFDDVRLCESQADSTLR